MTAADTIAALVAIGVEIDPVNAKLVRPLDFTRHAELADLIPLVGAHRAAILGAILEPWDCAGCRTTFFVPVVDVREFIGVTCNRAECPLRGN